MLKLGVSQPVGFKRRLGKHTNTEVILISGVPFPNRSILQVYLVKQTFL